jgi:hypothetical protein
LIRIVIALGLAAALLTACGLKGDLVRPVPLWGAPPNEGPLDPRTIKAVEEAAAAQKERQAAERRAADAAAAETPTQQKATPAPSSQPQ